MKFKLSLFILITSFLIQTSVSGQLSSFENLEEVSEKGFFKNYFSGLFKDFTQFGDPFTMSGGIGLNMRSYSAYGGETRQDPFFYSLNANLNVRVYKLNIPFSIMVTARNRESALPNFREIANAFKDDLLSQKDRFVRMGMSPQYKWIKLHLGHRSMNFSKFTLANLNFYGVGTELTPGKLRVAAMYGRLAKAEPIDLSLVTPNVPVYQRVGWGTKLGYGTDNSSIDAMIFKAHDNTNSIDIPTDNEGAPSPEDNLTMGINLQHLFLDRFRLRVETGWSLLSPNALDEVTNNGFLFDKRATTETKSAFDARLDYEGEKFTTGVQVKRIDPNYKSLGAYFFNSDIIDLLGNLSFGMLDGKINSRLSAGIQSNNLDKSKPTTTRRFVYTGNITYSQDAFNANLNYSNNTTDVGYILNQSLDSLNAVIVTQDIGLNLTYSLTDKGANQHAFNWSGNIQQVNDDIENPMESASSRLYVSNFVYSYMLSDSKWRFSAKANFNQNQLAQMTTKRYGTGFGVSKSFLENKMNLGIDFNFFQNVNETADNSNNLNGGFRWSYNIGKGLTTNMNWAILRTKSENINPYSELTGTFGLNYTFNVNPKLKMEKAAVEKAVHEPLQSTPYTAALPDHPSDLTMRQFDNESNTLTATQSNSANNSTREEVLAQLEAFEKEAAANKPSPEELEKRRLAYIAEQEKKQAETTIAKSENNSSTIDVKSLLPSPNKTEKIIETKPIAEKQSTKKSTAKRKSVKKTTPTDYGTFCVQQETSLRAEATHKATSLKRLKEHEVVLVLEKTNALWWKVEIDGQIGYVKAKLLD